MPLEESWTSSYSRLTPNRPFHPVLLVEVWFLLSVCLLVSCCFLGAHMEMVELQEMHKLNRYYSGVSQVTIKPCLCWWSGPQLITLDPFMLALMDIGVPYYTFFHALWCLRARVLLHDEWPLRYTLAGVCVQGHPHKRCWISWVFVCLFIFLLGYLYFSCWCEEDIYRLFRMNFLLQIGFMFALVACHDKGRSFFASCIWPFLDSYSKAGCWQHDAPVLVCWILAEMCLSIHIFFLHLLC